MLVWVPSMNLPLSRLPFFNSKESARAATAATHRAIITPQICVAFITSSPVYSLCYIAFKPGSLLFAGLRRVILEQLGHCLLQILVILIRVFLEVEGLTSISAPDQLLFCGVKEVNQQHSDGNSRSLARYCTAIPSTPFARTAARGPGR